MPKGDAALAAAATGDGAIRATVSTAVAANSFTRPNNATAYAAGQVVGPAGAAGYGTLANAARVAAGTGLVLHAQLRDGANQATKGSFELWLFDAAPTAHADAAALALTSGAGGDLDKLVAVIPFANTDAVVANAGAGAAGAVVYGKEINPRGFRLPAGRDLFYLLVARNAYVPVALERFLVRLTVAQD